MPDKIKKIEATEILDSRGEPTLEVTVELNNGLKSSAKVPSGASTGRFEAHELRDEDPERYHGKGVLKAVDNVNRIIHRELAGLRVTEQEKIDLLMKELDGTKNKSKLGANAILGVSLACAYTAAKSVGLPLYRYLRQRYLPKDKEFLLPTPLVNVVNGGKHGDTNLNLQEFWLVPVGDKSFAEKLRQVSEVFYHLGQLLQATGHDIDLGNEGGYSPDMQSHREVFDFLLSAIEQAKFEPGEDIMLGLDAGASVFYNTARDRYNLALEKKEFTADELIDWYIGLMENFPLRYLEDPLGEEDWEAWKRFSKNEFIREQRVRLIGDDLFVTNTQRLQKGIELKVANTILIKPNQIGTLTETLQAIRLAQDHNYEVVISHRSGETNDTTIADLAVAVKAQYIKAGAPSRGERIAKYNRLLSIEKEVK